MYSEFEEQNETEIDVEKIYDFPDWIVRYFHNYVLVIAPETGNWLVFSEEVELKVFQDLANNHSIIDCLEKYDEEIVLTVLTQVEAKQFENRSVQYIDNAETMQIYLTNACNLRCKHCYMYADKSLENELTTDEIIRICERFKEAGGEYITVTGGEITLKKDIIKILTEIRRIGLGLHILSNGVLWSDELIETVSRLGVERVQISLDGFDERSNALIRGEGAFDKALDTVDKLVKRHVNVFLAVTPMYETLRNNKNRYIEFAKSLVQKYSEYSFIINFSFELIEGRDLHGTDIIQYSDSYMEIMSEICEAVYPGSEQESFVINHMDGKIFNNCGYGRLNISSNGNVYFCSRISEVKEYGNIRTMPFEEIQKLMRQARHLADVNSLRPCCDCDLKYICGGGCRVDKFKKLTEIDNLYETTNIPIRVCSSKNKDYYYKLMIETNDRFYR